jgi:cell division septal protein FtsQ
VKKNKYLYNYYYKKNNNKFSKLFFYTLFFVFIIFLMYFITNKMKVENIEIFGTKNISKEEIQKVLPLNIGDKLISLDLLNIEHKLKLYKPELKDVVVSRGWKKIKIQFKERKPEAFLFYNKIKTGIDFDNVMFPLYGTYKNVVVPILFYQSMNERIKLVTFLKNLKNIDSSFLKKILHIKLNSFDEMILLMRNGTIILWGTELTIHLQDKYSKFIKIYKDAERRYSKLDYIDMTSYYWGKAIVKPVNYI